MTRRLSFIFSLLLFLSANAQTIDIDSLFIESVGGQKAYERLKRLKSFKLTGKIIWNGLEGDFTTIYQAPNKFITTSDFRHFIMARGYDGEIAWQKDFNGRNSKLSGYEKQEIINNLYLLSYQYLLNKNSDRACEYLQTTGGDDNSYHYINCFAKEDDTLTLVFEEDNSRLAYISNTIDNLPVNTSFHDYREIEGIIFPFKSITTSPIAPIRTELFTKEIQFDVTTDSSLFTIHSKILSDFHFPEDSHSVTIPFLFRNGHVLVRLQVNGSKFGWFILDTGASTSFYHKKFVEGLKLVNLGELPVMGLGGYENLQLTKFDSISVGSVTLYEQIAGVLPLDVLAGQIQKKMTFGGLLGYDFFVRFPVLINFKSETITVFNPDKFEIENSQRTIPFHLTMMVPTVKAKVNGVQGDFLIDLGNAFGIIIHQNFGRRLASVGQLKIDSSSSTYLGGVAKGVMGSKISVANLMLGDLEIRVSEGLLVDSGSGMIGSRYISGNIGTMILENYQILFDYANSRLFLFEPSSSTFKPH